jgi:hypothetical protein
MDVAMIKYSHVNRKKIMLLLYYFFSLLFWLDLMTTSHTWYSYHLLTPLLIMLYWRVLFPFLKESNLAPWKETDQANQRPNARQPHLHLIRCMDQINGWDENPRCKIFLFLHPCSSCGGSSVAFCADVRAPPAGLPMSSTCAGAREDPFRRLLCGPLPGGHACVDLRSHSVVVLARPPASGPYVAPRRWPCYRTRCGCGDEEACLRLPWPRRTRTNTTATMNQQEVIRDLVS